MKHLQLYEDFKSIFRWEVGDIVVATENRYAGDTYWLKRGERYEIVEIMFNDDVIKVKDVSSKIVLKTNFFKTIFMTEEEWILNIKIDKYNI